ncbi:MAG: hypothetical protein GPJ03_06150, partial [Microcystis aeruginosa G13-01]|nr:hypothetical protein [Microcystis aeruginosa G13-01]
TGKNDGSGTTVSNWYDRVVFSKNNIYGDSDDIYLTEQLISSSNGLPLEPNETYTASRTVTLPSSVVSNGYLLVRTDVYNNQAESNENDNVYAQAIDIAAPNLIITNFTAPSTASTRQTIALSWTVQNQGTGVTNTSSWYDRIVFSSDTIFGNSDDIHLTEIWDLTDIRASTFANLPLDPDETYNVTQNITLPDTVAGNGYLLVKTDNYNGQLESNETDNIRSVAIAVNAPNLVISNPTSPPSAAVLGQTVPLSWRVTNTGTVSALAGWRDGVYLSNDGLLDSNDVNIGQFFLPNSLAPNASYTNSRNIFLPATGIGDRYLLFVTDAYRVQGETNETDNIIATPITLTAPDLTVTAATAPTTAVTSGTFNVSWTVTNGGDVVASADWLDEVLLSTNTIWGDFDDRSIGTVSIAAQTPLNPNSSYTIERTVTLPSVVAGNYNLLFRADSSNQQGETNENNNVRSLPIAIAVPDLVVAAATAPTNGIASQSIAVSWTVTNQGTVDAAADWYDSVYLSTNNTFEGFNDIWIASDLISTQTPLLAGNSYTLTRNVTLPNRPAGDYFLLFLADKNASWWWDNSQRETDENNNVRAVPITIGVPDLTVSAATAPSSGVLGGAIDVSWTVTNTSAVTAPADWSDRIYFSTDEVWNPSSDTLITSEAIATQTPLNAGLSYTVNRTITLPNVASNGSGYLLFVADANANQAESNENNNVRSVPFTLNAPNLTVTGATAPSSVSLGSTIAVTWTVANSGQFPANANWYDSVYLSDTFGTSDVSLGERWSGNSQPIAVGGTYTGTLNITLPTTTTGNSYLLFITDRYANYSTTLNNRQGETNENDNVFALPINISSADLVLESAIAPSGGIIGNPITLSWTVKNQGTGEAPQDWRDYVYLSLNQTLDGSDTLLVNEAIATQTPLAADGSYTINKTVNLASITPGTRYLIFVADGSGNQGEINETNNQRVVEIVVTAPDLIVSTANAPTTAITGSNIAVSWTTSNQGTSEASADWSDAVYLSGDSLLDASDIFITSEAIASQTPLAAGASYTISRNIALPSNVSGDRFLLFVADNSNAQGEVDNTNNVRAVPIGINASAILSFSAATFRVNEDGTAIAPVTIERSGIITESVTVTLNLSNGTAIAGSDYNNTPITVNFAPGETSKTVNIPIINDTRFEPEETVDLTLSNPSAGAVIGVQNTAVLTIVSDDLPVYGKLSFSNAQFTVREDGVAIVAVTVIRTDGSDGNVGATINLTDGTAIAIGDYNNASVTVNFTPGETSQTIVIPIVNDAIYEPDETINLTLTNPTGGATLGSQTTATLTILDNDPPQQGILAFSQSSYSINENGTAVTQVTVMRSGGSDGEVSATINLFNGSATAPSDYNSSPIIVNFANGETSKTVVIPIVNDTVYEANETINLTLTNPTGGAIIRGQNTAVVTIVNDDIELNFSSRTYNAGENGVPAAQVTVNRAGITSVPVGVTLLLRNGTATAPDDYLDTPIAVTFAPGETSKTVTLPIVDDEQLEANETILLSLTDPTNGATLGSQATASLTIASDDLPDLVVSNIVAPTNTQSGKSIEITWTLKNQGNADASGTWTDYVYLSNDATIGNDQFLGSFSFTGAITVGSSVDRTQSIFLPLTLSGERRIIIQTNGNNGLKERPGRESNNTTIDDVPITIVSNLANLEVSSVLPPATAFSSQETVVEWIVTNTGVGATNASIWYDQVWLSLDDKLDPSDVYLGQAKNASFLNPNESYRNSLAVTLPQGIQGNYRFLVRTDFSSSGNRSSAGPVIESNENDNVGASSATQINLTPSPDLQITAVSTPTQTFSGQPMLLTWTVTNKGQGRTLLSNRIIDSGINNSDVTTEVQLSNNNNRSLAWYDKVYMSSDEVLDAGDRYLGQYLRTGNLNPDDSYTANLTVDLPIGVSGDYYFLIQTDANNQIFEGIQEGNNTAYDTPATVVKLTPPPDLEIEFIQSPTQATASRSLSFTYRVTNFGATVTPNKFWTDTFYLSTDNKLDLQTDLRLGSNPRYDSLIPDAAYTNTVSYTLPNTITGTYYLFGVTDSNNAVFELDNTNNIAIAGTPINITSRPADLAVSATNDNTAEAGKSLRVNWTVTNQGTGDTVVSNWNDRILLSSDNIIGNSGDIVLGDFNRNGLLNVGESYTRSELFSLPFNLIGNYNLYVITDSSNQVYEGNNEGNNTAVQTINVTRQTADLQVTQVTAPNTTASGQPLTVSWKVQNFGNNRTSSDYWYDLVYLSTDNQISSDDIDLGYVYRSGALALNSDYTASRTFNLPIDLQGNYYTIVRTDVGGNVIEGSFENNNDGVTVSTTAISLSPTPDLIITSINAPATAVSGQSVNVTWTVRNAGTGATGDRRWYETFYLSRDAVFDSNDTYLGYSDYQGNLASEGSYTKTQAFRLPQSFSGAAYIFAVTDAGSQVYERGLENNNVGSTPNSFQVTLAQPADIVVGTITIPSDAIAGRNITIGYTVNNQGANPIQGSWSDALYFSQDNQWDINDVFFTEVTNSGTVTSGGSYSQTITAPLPGLAVGDYHLIIRSDIRNQVFESNDANNLKASLDQVDVDVERLNLGTASTGTLAQGQGFYYRFNGTAGQTIRLRMDSQNNETVNSLFISRGEMPTRTKFEVTDPTPFVADPTIVLPITEDGTYYVLAYGNTSASSTPYTIIAEEIPFSILGLGVETVGNTGEVTIEVDGALFANDTSFRLVDSAGKNVNAKRTFLEDSTKAFITFDLDGKAAGIYDIQAVKTDGRVVSLNDSLTVQDNFDANLVTNLDGPLQVRPQRDNTFNLIYGNNGGTDIIAPLLLVESASNSPFGLSQKSMVGGATLQILSSSQDGPLNILRPGETQSVPVYFKSSQVNDLAFRIRAIEADDTTEISVEDWASIEKSIRPQGLTDTQWQNFWGEIQPRIGTTWGDYVQMLNRLSQEVSSVGEGERDVRDMFAELYGLDPNYRPASSMSGQLLDAKTGEALAGVEVGAYRTVDGVYELGGSAVTDAEGRFMISYLQAGNYELALADKNFDMDRDGNEDFQPPSYAVSETTDLTDVTIYGHHPEPEQPQIDESETALTVDGNGISHIIWRRDGQIWHSYFDGSNWIDAAPITGAEGSNISIQAANNLIDGNSSGLIATWEQGGGNSSEIYYSVGRAKTGGGFEWSDPLTLTNDSVEDRNASLVVLQDGTVLTVGQKSNFDIEDDTDLYFELLKINSQNLQNNYSYPLTIANFGQEFNVQPQSTGSWGGSITFKEGLTVPRWVPIFGGFYGLEVSGEIQGNKDCEGANAQSSLKAQIDTPLGFGEGSGQYKDQWTINKEECKYEFEERSLSLSATIAQKIKLPFDFAKELLRKIERIGIRHNIFPEFEGWIGGGGGGTASINKNGDIRGALQASFTAGAAAKIGVFKLSNNRWFQNPLDVKTIRLEDFKLSLSGELQADILPKKNVQGKVTLTLEGALLAGIKGSLSYSWEFGGATTNSLSTLDNFENILSFQNLIDTSNTFIGTGNTYSENHILSNVAEDFYNDSPSSLITTSNRKVLATWIKDKKGDNNQNGNVIVVAEFNGTSWEMPIELPNSFGYNQNTAITTNVNGDPIVFWSMADSSLITQSANSDEIFQALGDTDIVYSIYQNGSWSSPNKFLPMTGGDYNPISIIDSNGNLALIWINSDNNQESLVSSFWNGTNWTTPLLITTNQSVQDPSLSIVNGNLTVFWSADINPDPEITSNRVFYSIYNQAWTTPQIFSPAVSSTVTEIFNAEIEDNQGSQLTTSFIAGFGSPGSPPEDCCKCEGIKERRRIESRTGCNGRSGSETTFDKETCIETTIVYIPETCPPKDPNDIIGPIGFGQENWIANSTLPYTIRFENDPVFASAAAQEVIITQQLDADLDWRTFRLDDFGWGGLIFDLPGNTAFHSQRFNFTQEYGFLVDVTAGIDIATGVATWHIITIDPNTGDKPLGVDQGFLPVNNDEGIGEGFVSYQVRTKRTIQTGTVIDAQARIIFDTEEPIDTPPIFNTIDINAPITSVKPLAAITNNPEFLVQWQGNDDNNGSAIADYTVYVSENGGTFTPWLVDTLLTEATYVGTTGNTYAFYAIASDNAGNIEITPTAAQATTRIAGGTGTLGDFVWFDKNANGIQDINESGIANITVKLYDSTNSLVTTTTTNASGNYSFSNLTTGDYSIEVIAPDGYLFSPQNQGTDSQDSDVNSTTGKTELLTVNSGNNLTLDVGLYQLGSIAGQVWNDIDGNAVNNSEPSLSGWTVYLDTNNNNQLDTGETS